VQEHFMQMVRVWRHGQEEEEGIHSNLLSRPRLRTLVQNSNIVIRYKARKVIRLCNITTELLSSCTGGLPTGHGRVVMNFYLCQQLDQRGRPPRHLQRDQQQY